MALHARAPPVPPPTPISTSINASGPLDTLKVRPISSPTQWTRAAMLRKCAHAFCMALQSSEFEPHEFVRTFFVPDDGATIYEHGPGWARKELPFLGQRFQGRDGCLKYFEALNNTLIMFLPDDAFPPDEQLIVDAEAETESGLKGVVCISGKGTFEHKVTGWAWEEKFMYKLSGFDEDGRISSWEIWADPLSAMEATRTRKTDVAGK